MFRFLHTADWHLGQKLDKFDRIEEHTAFINWLINLLSERPVDAVLICGDVFDSSNPPVSALRLFIRFVVQAKKLCPNIVIIAGNHDSAGRLDALKPILQELGVVLIGALPEKPEDCIFSLEDREGKPSVLIAVVPYLRSIDLPPIESGIDTDTRSERIISGIKSQYKKIVSVLKQRKINEHLIVMGHLFAAGAVKTGDSERPIQLEAGSIQAVPATIFDQSIDYVALGHLHRSQQIEGPVPIWYSGSPIPLSFAETAYKNRVLMVTIPQQQGVINVDKMPVPRSVNMVDLIGTFSEINEELIELADKYPKDGENKAIVRVSVSMNGPMPDLRDRVFELVEESEVMVLAIRKSGEIPGSLADAMADDIELEQLEPLDVFIHKYAEEYETEPSNELKQAFLELLEQASNPDESDSRENP